MVKSQQHQLGQSISATERRAKMTLTKEELARSLEDTLNQAWRDVAVWREENTMVADWRIEDMYSGLRRAAFGARKLVAGETL